MTTKKIALYALIASVYTVLSLVIAPFSFGQIQIRLGEALMVLCLIDKDYVYALTLGCFLTNLIGVITGMDVMVLDIIVGTLATFIAGILTYHFRNIKTFGQPIFPLLWVAIINAILVGLELHFYLQLDLWANMLYVGIGEIIAVAIGLLLFKPMKRFFSDIFK